MFGLPARRQQRRSCVALKSIRLIRVSASVTTTATATEKSSGVPEIVLQPIQEISGVVNLPGSKSLSNRILLLAALAEVCCFKVSIFEMCV